MLFNWTNMPTTRFIHSRVKLTNKRENARQTHSVLHSVRPMAVSLRSFVPLSAYLILRNCTEGLRKRYLYLFAYMGRTTLETYIFQFHIWMRTTGLNGSPKKLLVVVPGSYWLNFAVLTAIYIFVSIRFSHLTGVLRDALIPSSLRAMLWISVALLTAGGLCWILSLMWTGSIPMPGLR